MKEGKIINYDGYIGEIETPDDNYIFLSDDIIGEVEHGEYVTFRAEDIKGIKRAFFVKSKKNEKTLSMRSDNERNNN